MKEFEYEIFDSISHIPSSDWMKVWPASAMEDYAFFGVLDRSNLEQFIFKYIVVYKDDQPVGAATCFIMDFPLDIGVSGLLKAVSNAVRKLFPRLINPRVVICGMPMGNGRIGINAERASIVRSIDQALEEIGHNNKTDLIFYKDMNLEDKNFIAPLLPGGYTCIESYPNTELQITFKSFDEYLKTLSASSREGLKRNFKKVDSQVRFNLEIREQLDEPTLSLAHDLYIQTFNKHELGFEKLTKDYFRNIGLMMPKENKFFLWWHEGKLVAFAQCLVRGDYFIDYYLGFDYSVSNQYYLYFIRFRDLLNWCMANGIRRYEMGQTSYEPKRRLGFKFVRYFLFIKHRHPFFNWILKPLIHLMKPENFDPVFKNFNLTA